MSKFIAFIYGRLLLPHDFLAYLVPSRFCIWLSGPMEASGDMQDLQPH